MRYINVLISALEAIDLFLISMFATNPGNVTGIVKTKQTGIWKNNLSTLFRSIAIFLGHCVPRRKFRKCRG
jgi:hypothetical protein